jgi:predicted Zn-dependent protease with MMP-like domain
MEIMDKEEFEGIILKTVENIPEKFKKKLENLSIVVEENEVVYSQSQNGSDKRLTLGLYHGVPITARPGKRIMFPDKITIYKKSIEQISTSMEEIEKNTRKVVLHELGHYFGLGEDKLSELGY